MITFWAVLFTNLYTFPMYIAARSGAGLSDALLARGDAALGLTVPTVLGFVREHPRVGQILSLAYDALKLLMLLPVLVLPLLGRMRQAKEYLVGCMVAALIAFPIFAFVQAVGPWAHHGYAPRVDQEMTMRVFLALKRPEVFRLDFQKVEGLIAFPSFHTILAVLGAVALWPQRHLRWPSLVLAVMVIISTVTTGWHYVVDVLSGLAVAALTVVLSRAFGRLDERVSAGLSAAGSAAAERSP
jgi:membrane-associated phospholipid phosphatase